MLCGKHCARHLDWYSSWMLRLAVNSIATFMMVAVVVDCNLLLFPVS